MKFRCSSLHFLMGEPRKKGEVLSETAKSAILKMAKQIVYGVEFSISNKYVTKGLAVEQMAIDLLNKVRGTSYTKNDERKTNEWITGEADIVTDTHGIDIKSPWSLETLPLTAEEGDKPEYEWQARGYMMLYDLPRWEIVYVGVDTPPELCKWDPPQMHAFWRVPPHKRITTVDYTRDQALEDKIKEKCEAAADLLKQLVFLRGSLDDLSIELNPALKGWQLEPTDWTTRSNDAAKTAFFEEDYLK